MLIKKGQKIFVKHKRKGSFNAIAEKDFDTEKDEWYPIILDDDMVDGLNTDWVKGEHIPARRGLCSVSLGSKK